jgi:heme a synthase
MVEHWLWAVAGLVFAMVVVGGATRLTGSGLSITEWKPILGAIPPLNERDWLAAFEKYKQIPQYALVNKGMALADFKFIYGWEWGHRLLGRLVGVAYALPLLVFWLTDRLGAGTAPKFVFVLALGGLQGFIGWYMVKSGLADRVSVSQYRLALHLTLAFAILGCLVWLARDEAEARQRVTGPRASKGGRRRAGFLVALIGLQVMLGALVAGLKAGLVYNTWPDMNGRLIPDGLWPLTPWYLNVFETVETVQFDHRMVAYGIGLLALVHMFRKASRPVDQRVRRSRLVLALAVFAQIVLGIVTLLYGVPLWLGLAHQAGAALLLIAAVWHLHASLRAGVGRA